METLSVELNHIKFYEGSTLKNKTNENNYSKPNECAVTAWIIIQ
jgi:hypothetical protein